MVHRGGSDGGGGKRTRSSRTEAAACYIDVSIRQAHGEIFRPNDSGHVKGEEINKAPLDSELPRRYAAVASRSGDQDQYRRLKVRGFSWI